MKALQPSVVRCLLRAPQINMPAYGSVRANFTCPGEADAVYFMPVTPQHVEELIMKEKPDGIILSMGGQTALVSALSFLCLSLRFHGFSLPFVRWQQLLRSLPFVIFHRLSPRCCCCDRRTAALRCGRRAPSRSTGCRSSALASTPSLPPRTGICSR